jgi:AbrB family looped-hinge helix DNA binding protein
MSKALAVKVGPKGRVVLPAPVRRELHIEEGDELVVIVEDDGALLMTRTAAIARLRLLMGPSKPPGAGEVMANRRAEVERSRQEERGRREESE